MPVWPFAAYTAAMIGLIARLAQPTAICFGLGRVGQRTKHVEHAWHAERRANRTDETHGGVEGACESECDAAFVADLSSPVPESDPVGRPSASKQSAVPHLDEAARLPCLTTLTPVGRGYHRSHG